MKLDHTAPETATLRGSCCHDNYISEEQQKKLHKSRYKEYKMCKEFKIEETEYEIVKIFEREHEKKCGGFLFFAAALFSEKTKRKTTKTWFAC